jgi:hypothetical protein
MKLTVDQPSGGKRATPLLSDHTLVGAANINNTVTTNGSNRDRTIRGKRLPNTELRNMPDREVTGEEK